MRHPERTAVIRRTGTRSSNGRGRGRGICYCCTKTGSTGGRWDAGRARLKHMIAVSETLNGSGRSQAARPHGLAGIAGRSGAVRMQNVYANSRVSRPRRRRAPASQPALSPTPLHTKAIASAWIERYVYRPCACACVGSVSSVERQVNRRIHTEEVQEYVRQPCYVFAPVLSSVRSGVVT